MVYDYLLNMGLSYVDFSNHSEKLIEELLWAAKRVFRISQKMC